MGGGRKKGKEKENKKRGDGEQGSERGRGGRGGGQTKEEGGGRGKGGREKEGSKRDGDSIIIVSSHRRVQHNKAHLYDAQSQTCAAQQGPPL